MSVVKTLNKIADQKEVNLKAEIIALNIVKDLAKVSNTLRNAVGEADRVSSNMYARRNDVEQAIDVINDLRGDFRQSEGKIANLGGSLDDLVKLSDKLEASAKQLGVNPMDIEGVKEALKIQSDGMDVLKEIKAEQKRTESTLKKI